MPRQPDEPIGPFPPGADAGEYDKLRRRVLWKMPTGLYVVGSRDAAGGRRNLMTANWVMQVSFDPKLVVVSIEKHAVTHGFVAEARVFAVNILDREDRTIVRKFTKPVVDDDDRAAVPHTLNGFVYHDGARTGAPVLDQAVAYLECEVRQDIDAGGSTVFLGEVVDAAFQRDEATDVLRMEDTRMNYGG